MTTWFDMAAWYRHQWVVIRKGGFAIRSSKIRKSFNAWVSVAERNAPTELEFSSCALGPSRMVRAAFSSWCNATIRAVHFSRQHAWTVARAMEALRSSIRSSERAAWVHWCQVASERRLRHQASIETKKAGDGGSYYDEAAEDRLDEASSPPR